MNPKEKAITKLMGVHEFTRKGEKHYKGDDLDYWVKSRKDEESCSYCGKHFGRSNEQTKLLKAHEDKCTK